MIKDWPVVKLQEVCEQITVGHVGPMTKEYQHDGVPFLRSRDIVPFGIDESDLKYISEEFHQKLKKSALKPSDVVIVRTGKPGTAAVVPCSLPRSNCSDLVIVRTGNSLDPRYLTYYLNSAASHHIASVLVGAVQQHFNVGEAKRLKLPLPTIDEQRRIVRVLGRLDDKIELNRKTARTLEELAQRLFKNWFVDFGPVRAKMAGRQPAHMPPETAALFPDEFVDSALGPIPQGWEVKPIEDIVTIKGGGTPPTKQSEYWEGGTHHWATPKDLSGLEQKVLIDTDRKITSAGVEKISSGQLPAGTVLMSSRAPVGYLALADMPVSINQGFIAMICDRGVPNTYILHWAESSMDVIKSNAGGSTFAEISKKQFRPLETIVPPAAILKVYDELAGGWFERISLLAHENVILGKLRDRLLPKLISGEIRIPEAHEGIEEAIT